MITATVTPTDFGGDVFVSPADANQRRPTGRACHERANGPFAAAKLSLGISANVPYTGQAEVLAITGRSARDRQRDGCRRVPTTPTGSTRYLEIEPGSVGDLVVRHCQLIYNGLPATSATRTTSPRPYRTTSTARARRSPTTTDLRGLCAAKQKIDCFLTIKKGFCVYFASTMVMMLRELHIPARYVVGYLPGQQQSDGSWLVRAQRVTRLGRGLFRRSTAGLNSIPTPGNSDNGQTPTHLAEGVPLAIGSPRPASPAPAQQDPNCVGSDRVSRACLDAQDPATVTPPPPQPPNYTLGILGAGLAVIGALALVAIFLIRRVPTSEPEIAFSGLSRLAARLGYGPRPSQTPYEFADHLGELVPVASGDVHLIATAKVEATYGRRRPEDGRWASIGEAYRRARLGLLRLLVRKPKAFEGRAA